MCLAGCDTDRSSASSPDVSQQKSASLVHFWRRAIYKDGAHAVGPPKRRRLREFGVRHDATHGLRHGRGPIFSLFFWPLLKVIVNCILVVPYFNRSRLIYESYMKPLISHPESAIENTEWIMERGGDVLGVLNKVGTTIGQNIPPPRKIMNMYSGSLPLPRLVLGYALTQAITKRQMTSPE
ncbi:hypothetical protein Scep_017379 [Stephania cephalantha]|uniref:Uncharacterized protein n=1 Tax=Stephania cephalantha TaxID=152367 RepID=A0AAP0IPE9_9MAGN